MCSHFCVPNFFLCSQFWEASSECFKLWCHRIYHFCCCFETKLVNGVLKAFNGLKKNFTSNSYFAPNRSLFSSISIFFIFISLLKDSLGIGDGLSSSSSPRSSFWSDPSLVLSFCSFGVSFGQEARSSSIASCRFSARRIRKGVEWCFITFIKRHINPADRFVCHHYAFKLVQIKIRHFFWIQMWVNIRRRLKSLSMEKSEGVPLNFQRVFQDH